MIKKAKYLSLFLLFVSTSYADQNDQAMSNFNAALHKAPLLYVASAPQSSLTVNAANKQEYSLTLYNVDPNITYFSNRPQRLTGKLPLQDFINYWHSGKDSFADNPPNADFTALTSDTSEQVNQVVKLKNISYDQKTKTLMFNVSFLSPVKQSIPQQNLKDTNLFIDFNWNNNIP